MTDEVLDKPVVEIKKVSEVLQNEPEVMFAQSKDIKPEQKYEYASFWIRLGAFLIDGVLCAVVYIFVYIIAIVGFFGQNGLLDESRLNWFKSICTSSLDSNSPRDLSSLNSECRDIYAKLNNTLLYANIFLFILLTSYFVLLPLTKWQGTVGKKLLKLRIVNSEKKSINLTQSLARHIFWIFYELCGVLVFFLPRLSLVSNVLLIVLIVDNVKILFTEKNTSLHDNIAQTFVLKLSDTF